MAQPKKIYKTKFHKSHMLRLGLDGFIARRRRNDDLFCEANGLGGYEERDHGLVGDCYVTEWVHS